MALSMDEQRALAEIERRLASDDPGLATCMTAFRRPGPARVLTSPRARIIGSLFTVLLVAMVSLMVYAMIPFRAYSTRAPATRTGGTSSNIAITATGSSAPPPTSSNASASAAVSAPSSAKAATPSVGARASQAKDQAASQAASPVTGP
jgi:Protein of unknown function (DUF3040)